MVKLLCCVSIFRNFYGLSQHVNSKHKEVPTIYPCNFCDKKDILTSQQRSQHKRDVHGIRQNKDDRIFQCNICKKELSSKLERSKHMVGSHNLKQNKLSCDNCGKKVASEIRMQIHKSSCINING